MDLHFTTVEDRHGETWGARFRELWPAYRHWYLREGIENRPTYLESRMALRQYMPEMVPLWEQCVDAAGGGDLEARLLSLYCPPAYLTGCSQAVWPGASPLLVRNYDYHPGAFDAMALQSHWGGRTVLGTSDCMIGLVDGINDAGLALSLTFGGRRVVGTGFGVPMILRHVLQCCETTAQATRILARVPTHMAYNVTVLDAKRRYATVYMAPDREAVVTRSAVATNHQGRVDWASHERATSSVRRERYLLQRLTLHSEPQQEFVNAFLRPPLYSLAFDRGFGTLYTAALRPAEGTLTYHWLNRHLHLDMNNFQTEECRIRYPSPVAIP
ncbi:MAG: C45 family peptidase [Rhodanobacteraceae bacterium]